MWAFFFFSLVPRHRPIIQTTFPLRTARECLVTLPPPDCSGKPGKGRRLLGCMEEGGKDGVN